LPTYVSLHQHSLLACFSYQHFELVNAVVTGVAVSCSSEKAGGTILCIKQQVFTTSAVIPKFVGLCFYLGHSRKVQQSLINLDLDCAEQQRDALFC
jgi:hypothetical protein